MSSSKGQEDPLEEDLQHFKKQSFMLEHRINTLGSQIKGA